MIIQWVNWAAANGIIKKDTTKEELIRKKKMLVVSLAIGGIISLAGFFLLVLYTSRNQPPDPVSTEDLFTFYFMLACIISVYLLLNFKHRYYLDFRSKIEGHLQELFPHSNNENYARENVPVSNNIRT